MGGTSLALNNCACNRPKELDMRTQNSFPRNGLGLVVAVTLSLSMALFGCTTNHNPGNGQPERRPNAAPTSPSSPPVSSSGTSFVPLPSTSCAPYLPLT